MRTCFHKSCAIWLAKQVICKVLQEKSDEFSQNLLEVILKWFKILWSRYESKNGRILRSHILRSMLGFFFNVIKILQRIYGLFNFHRKYYDFYINNFLFIPVKVLIFLPTVFCSFFPLTIPIFDRSFMSIRPQFEVPRF